VRLSAPPVHVLSRAMLAQLDAALAAVEADAGVSAVVLASSGPSVFSAGLDIREFAAPTSETALREYSRAVRDVFLRLWVHAKPVIAAIRGAAPAGGCWLALQVSGEWGGGGGKWFIGPACGCGADLEPSTAHLPFSTLARRRTTASW